VLFVHTLHVLLQHCFGYLRPLRVLPSVFDGSLVVVIGLCVSIKVSVEGRMATRARRAAIVRLGSGIGGINNRRKTAHD